MSAVGLVGGALAVAGGLIQFNAQQTMVEKQTKISKKAENIRKQQMLLDVDRRKRAAIRQGLMQRSMALSNGASQGASLGSGVAAGKGSGAAQAAEGAQTTNSASILGQRMFVGNAQYFDATKDGQFWSGLGGGLSSVGGTVLGNAGQINALAGW